jgi:hypothetical protein
MSRLSDSPEGDARSSHSLHWCRQNHKKHIRWVKYGMIQPDSVHIPFFILHYIYIHIYASILTASKFQRSHPPFDFWTVPYHIVCDIYIYWYIQSFPWWPMVYTHYVGWNIMIFKLSPVPIRECYIPCLTLQFCWLYETHPSDYQALYIRMFRS